MPRTAHASRQPSSCPSWIAVFMPIPAIGVIRCAASPITNAGPDRTAVATSAAIVNAPVARSSGQSPGIPVAVRSSSVQRAGV
ncbi:hypothetical protein BJF90_05295 [Pseudonocardia sp. CNS-004]|nr:hypothetical protein BJF90_05295 [Pseudonocardia sp. CNS-004]